jgi:hypothetical protein
MIKLLLLEDLMTKIKYNNILIITNQLTKYTYFINYLESLNVEDLIYTFLRVIFTNHSILAIIILDWDKLFTSKFWKSLID